jgi:hypothetical protein
VRLRFVYYTLFYAREMGTSHHPAIRKLRRAYFARNLAYGLRELVTWCLPFVDLLKKDGDYPRWLVARRARRTLDSERDARANEARSSSR